MCSYSYSSEAFCLSRLSNLDFVCADQSNIMDFSHDFSTEEVVSWLRAHGFSSETSARGAGMAQW